MAVLLMLALMCFFSIGPKNTEAIEGFYYQHENNTTANIAVSIHNSGQETIVIDRIKVHFFTPNEPKYVEESNDERYSIGPGEKLVSAFGVPVGAEQIKVIYLSFEEEENREILLARASSSLPRSGEVPPGEEKKLIFY